MEYNFCATRHDISEADLDNVYINTSLVDIKELAFSHSGISLGVGNHGIGLDKISDWPFNLKYVGTSDLNGKNIFLITGSFGFMPDGYPEDCSLPPYAPLLVVVKIVQEDGEINYVSIDNRRLMRYFQLICYINTKIKQAQTLNDTNETLECINDIKGMGIEEFIGNVELMQNSIIYVPCIVFDSNVKIKQFTGTHYQCLKKTDNSNGKINSDISGCEFIDVLRKRGGTHFVDETPYKGIKHLPIDNTPLSVDRHKLNIFKEKIKSIKDQLVSQFFNGQATSVEDICNFLLKQNNINIFLKLYAAINERENTRFEKDIISLYTINKLHYKILDTLFKNISKSIEKIISKKLNRFGATEEENLTYKTSLLEIKKINVGIDIIKQFLIDRPIIDFTTNLIGVLDRFKSSDLESKKKIIKDAIYQKENSETIKTRATVEKSKSEAGKLEVEKLQVEEELKRSNVTGAEIEQYKTAKTEIEQGLNSYKKTLAEKRSEQKKSPNNAELDAEIESLTNLMQDAKTRINRLNDSNQDIISAIEKQKNLEKIKEKIQKNSIDAEKAIKELEDATQKLKDATSEENIQEIIQENVKINDDVRDQISKITTNLQKIKDYLDQNIDIQQNYSDFITSLGKLKIKKLNIENLNIENLKNTSKIYYILNIQKILSGKIDINKYFKIDKSSTNSAMENSVVDNNAIVKPKLPKLQRNYSIGGSQSIASSSDEKAFINIFPLGPKKWNKDTVLDIYDSFIVNCINYLRNKLFCKIILDSPINIIIINITNNIEFDIQEKIFKKRFLHFKEKDLEIYIKKLEMLREDDSIFINLN